MSLQFAKKGNRQEPGNYRPISFTSVFCKTMEKLIKGKIITRLEGNNLIDDSQHGFRNKRSCLTSLLDFSAPVIDTYDMGNNKAVDLIYLDFQKAFDMVPHERLLVKVMAHGIQGSAAQWIRNWLAERRQRVCIKQTFSSWTPVTSGVPQGSVLGPLLLVIYINDLDNGIVSKISKFANDSKLCRSSRHPDEVLELQEDLNGLVDGANTWQMNINIGKCAVMHTGHNNIQHNYIMANTTNSNRRTTRSRNHNNRRPQVEKHTEKICKTANRLLGFIARNFNYKSTQLIPTLHQSCLTPPGICS